MNAAAPTALDWLLASRQSEIASLRHLLHAGQLTGEISQLIHVLQRERGASNIWICSQGELFGDELPQRGRDVTHYMKSVVALLPALPALPAAGETRPGSSRLFSRIAAALYALSELPALRQQVRVLDITHAVAMARFSAVIRHLLNLVFEMVDTACDPGVSRALLAMFSFMQGKELVGQERAIGSAGFAAGRFTAEQSAQMLALIEAQERCFSHFIRFADAHSLQCWQGLGENESEVERLRRVACTGARTDERGAAVALRWYQRLTQRIDGLKNVEDSLAHALMQRCRQSIADAEAQTSLPAGELQQQLAAEESQPSGRFYLSVEGWGAQPASALAADGLTPQLGRSVLGLIQQQAKRLQDQDDELASMRASLEERKQIDRAKLLLMRHHHYSEEQAWQTLRKMAMNQNKRMVEIAAALLAVASAFSDTPK